MKQEINITSTSTDALAYRWKYYLETQPLGFKRGISDCCAFAAGWANLRAGALPGQEYLGTKLSDAEAIEIIRKHRNIYHLVGNMLERDGWVEGGDPESFDIVVIDHNGGFMGESVGVWKNGFLITKHESGGLVFVQDPKVKGVWKWE